MNRELKFRAWDTSGTKWMNLKDPEVALDPLSGQLVHVDDLSTSFWDFNDYEIMQFTGLHDKHGVEIYEGDVISQPSCPPRKVVIEPLGVGVRDEFGRWDGHVEHKLFDIVVIGNIYENPELVGETK